MFNPTTIRNDILKQPHDKFLEEKYPEFEFFRIEHDTQIHWAVCARRKSTNSPVLWLHHDGRLYSVIHRIAEGNCGSGYFESEVSLNNALTEYEDAKSGWIELNEESIEEVQLGALCLIKKQAPDEGIASPMGIVVGMFATVQAQKVSESDKFMEGLGVAPQSGGETREYRAFVSPDGKTVLASLETLEAELQVSGWKTYYKDIDLL